jgi:hypothetical protein
MSSPRSERRRTGIKNMALFFFLRQASVRIQLGWEIITNQKCAQTPAGDISESSIG